MKKTNIFIADDHKMVRESFRIALESEKDMQISGEAGDGEEAIAKIKNIKPDLIIMDINMPNLNGIDAIKEIRAFDKDVKIIMLTMLDNERFIIEALDAGINGFLYKDSEIDELITAIRQVIDGEDYFNEEVTKKIIRYHTRKTDSEYVESPAEEASSLTKRELEIIKLVSEGLSSNDIADKLYISYFTVQKHRKNIIKKLGLKNFNEIVTFAIQKGLI